MSEIQPCLWFAREAEEAARFYVALLPRSSIDKLVHAPANTPGPRAGQLLSVEFTLAGRPFVALNGGEAAAYSHALSLQILCADQAEVDQVWDAFLARGGAAAQCGWIKDPWGVQWQVVPEALPRLLSDPDPARARRAMQAMFTMQRLDVAALEAAAAG